MKPVPDAAIPRVKNLRTLPVLLPLFGALLGLAPIAHAQTSTLIYGSDTNTNTVEGYSPSPRVKVLDVQVNDAPNYQSDGAFELGLKGQYESNFGSAYDPKPVDVSQGFVVGFNVELNGSYGVGVVAEPPTSTTDLTDHISGAKGLPNSLEVCFVTDGAGPVAKLTGVQVYNADTLLTQTVSLPTGATGLNDFTGQVRYIPKFNDLDVYVNDLLVLRVPDVNLDTLGVTQDGQANLGITGSNPAQHFPAWLETFSIGNQLIFGSGFGPNSYEDRFPFYTANQSVWSQGSDSVSVREFAPKSGSGSASLPKDGGVYTLGSSDAPIATIGGSASISYHVGIGATFSATGGTATISYPLFLDMLFPAQYSIPIGNQFTLPASYYPDPAGTLTTTTPTADMTADFLFNVDAAVNLNASVFGQSIASGQLFHLSPNIPDTTFFDAEKVITSGLIPDVNGGINYAGEIQGSEGATGTKNSNEYGDRGEGGSGGDKDGGSSLADFISVGITVPDLSTSGVIGGTASQPSVLTSSASQPFVTLSSDFTNSLISLIPGLDVLTYLPFFNNDYTLNLADGYSLTAGLHIADLYGDVDLGTEVDYTFTPKPDAYLQLSVNGKPYNNETGSINSDGSDTNSVLGPFTFDATTGRLSGTMPIITMPNGPLTVTPYVTLADNTFQSTGKLTVGGLLSFDPFDIDLDIPDVVDLDTEGDFSWPFQVSGNASVYSYSPPSFATGTQTGGTAQAVPFQKALYGKPFTLLPKGSDNPMLVSVSPNSTGVGQAPPSLALTTQGTNYSTAVLWDYDGTPSDPNTTLSSSSGNATSLVATLTPSLLTTPGLHTLTLLNSNGANALYPSNSLAFTVEAPTPTVQQYTDGFLDNKIIAGGPGFTLAVVGSGFLPPAGDGNGAMDYAGSLVEWNGKPLATTYADEHMLRAAVPAGLITNAATSTITVFNAGPGGGTSNGLSVTPQNPEPVLTSLSQSAVEPGLSAFTLTLHGNKFIVGGQVTLTYTDDSGLQTHTLSYPPTSVTPVNVTLALPFGLLNTPRGYLVAYTNPAPGGGASRGLGFRVGSFQAGGSIILVPSLTRNGQGQPVLTLAVVNTGSTDATGVAISGVSGRTGNGTTVTATDETPPGGAATFQIVLVGTVPAGQSVTPTQTFTFPATSGATGKPLLLTVNGSANGAAFTSHLRVTLP